MPIKEKLETEKVVKTVWGKVISEKEAYNTAMRQIAGFSANLFQVMRILEPDWNKRTEAIASMANAMNMAVSGTDESLKAYMKAELYDKFNIPEFIDRSSWLGAFFGDSGDERENMSGRVIQFTRNRVEKELDTCPWDIVGSELCNMTTGMFTANFDLTSSSPNMENEMTVNMCEARGCGDEHCRVVAERRDKYNLPKQGWLDHMQQPVDPIHNTPKERRVQEGQILRNGMYTNTFGEEQSFEYSYNWCMQYCWAWSFGFPLLAIRDMSPTEEEFLRVFKIIFSDAGKNEFINFFTRDGLRNFLGVPNEIHWNDGRILGSWIKATMDMQLLPNTITRFTKDETWIQVKSEDFAGRFAMAPFEEITIGYEALWNNNAKTLISPEWSVWFEGKDEEDMTIIVKKKIDKYTV